LIGIGQFERQNLNHLYDEANFKVVLSNVLDKTNGSALSDWAQPFDYLTGQEETSDHKIGLLGI